MRIPVTRNIAVVGFDARAALAAIDPRIPASKAAEWIIRKVIIDRVKAALEKEVETGT